MTEANTLVTIEVELSEMSGLYVVTDDGESFDDEAHLSLAEAFDVVTERLDTYTKRHGRRVRIVGDAAPEIARMGIREAAAK